MFEDDQPQAPGAGPVPPPPLDPERLRGPRPGIGQTVGRKAPAPSGMGVQQPAQQSGQMKDWGPWRPKQNPGYDAPDTPEEIQQVLSQYNTQGPNAGGPVAPAGVPVPGGKGSGKKWFLIIAIVVGALVIAAGVYAYFTYFSPSANSNSNTNANSNQNANANTNAVNANMNSATNQANQNTNSTNSVLNFNLNLANSANQNTNTLNTNTTNANSNSNTNANVNSAGNTNSSTNLNLNTNTAVNTNVAANTNSAKDSDNDGLADFLEFIYGTDPNDPDSDDDGFNDGTEVENGYDPKGPGTL